MTAVPAASAVPASRTAGKLISELIMPQQRRQ